MQNIIVYTVHIATNLYTPSGRMLLFDTSKKYKIRKLSRNVVNIFFSTLSENNIL